LALVLVTSYQAITNRRFDAANGVTGELLAGLSVGQSFMARYDGLSGVELHLGTYFQGTGPARSSLVFHLMECGMPNLDCGTLSNQVIPDSDFRNPNSRVLATVRLPAGTQLEENEWYLFSFPPIADSQDNYYYVEIESPDGAPGHALTIFRWQPDTNNPQGDPYPNGAIYLNGRPQRGDLAFGLHYQPSPLSAALQISRDMSTNLSGAAIPLLIGMTIVLAGTLLYLLSALRDPERRRRWLRRWSLPFVLGVALLSGLLYMFVIPPWQGPDEHAHFAYAAMLDHYNFDYDKLQDIYSSGQAPDKQLVDAVNASMARYDFTRLVSGHPAPGSPPDAGATLLTALGKPPTYYWLGAVALRAARVLGLADDPYANPDTALIVLRGVSILLGMVVVALAWLAARIITSRAPGSPEGAEGLPRVERGDRGDEGNWLVLLLPLTVAILPMHTFDIAIFDNDVLADVAVSSLFVVLAVLMRRPSGWRALALVALAIALTVGGIFTKPTAEAAAPMLAAGLLVWIGLLVTRALDRRGMRNVEFGMRNESTSSTPHSAFVTSRRRALVVPGVIFGLLVLLAAGTLLAAYQPLNQTAGWIYTWVPLQPVVRVASPTAHDGSYVLDLGPKGDQQSTAFQTILPPVYHPAMKITVAGWVRVAPGAGKPLIASPAAVMRIEDGASPRARTDLLLDPAGTWQPISATADIKDGYRQIVLRIVSNNQRAQFDDFTLQVDQGNATWHDPVFQPTLINPSAESGFLGLRPELASRLPVNFVSAANVLPNPQPFDKVGLWGQYGSQQYDSFWGDFGWLSIPLPESLYTGLGLLTIAALAGLIVRVVRRWMLHADGGWTTNDWLGFIVLFSLVATIAGTYTWQMMQLATRNLTAGLSGRYLFVLIVPLAWLLLAGLGSISALVRSFVRRLYSYAALRNGTRASGAGVPSSSAHEGTAADSVLPWAAWLCVIGLTLFAAYCLLTLIIPYYYA
jgi:hypothetical protein